MIGKKRKLGRKIGDLKVGDTYSTKKTVEDRDLLLFLGLTDDANPLYIQHDYASQTPFKRPLVPPVMLYGMISSEISMNLPGPGSHILKQQLNHPNPVYHYEEIKIDLEIIEIDEGNHTVTLSVMGINNNDEKVIEGEILVCPPYKPESMTAKSLENFY